MPPKNTVPKKRTDSDTEEQGTLALRLIELLNDDAVLDKLKQVLYPKELSTQLKGLNAQIVRLQQQQLAVKDEKIKTLEERVNKLEIDTDGVEQYSRRANLQISGLAERDGGEDTDELVLKVINDNMGLVVERDDIERSHRLGRKTDANGRPRTRPVIVRFTTERLRDDVFHARMKLKNHNTKHRDSPIYINDDLTARRAKLAFDTRILKREKRIEDCWTTFGKVMVKTTTKLIKEIKSQADLLAEHTQLLNIGR